ncbi:SDR family oxidoreductase [Kineobactrum salinum]|uniref:SDR family oxidoreductase n=1 Tax=Kineobactrum salinum TaxID=2708301 RepID=A0A6C0U2V0_9GAMM|nr:SDR family oxidoreductase [Kineobactrum salinum]QIB65297.1 SDR family oxidoreductase [Kineobactrum salinum]
MFSLQAKVAFITGGTAGIGLATAKRLRAAGAEVIIVGRREAGRTLAAELGATFLQADLTREEELVAALAQARERFGGMDILFNNAGVENTGPTIEEAGPEQLQTLFDADLKAPYAVLHHGAALVRDGGSIINTASVAGMMQMPGYAQYSAVKAALISLTRTAALELAPRGIRVNAICPGSVWSEMLPRSIRRWKSSSCCVRSSASASRRKSPRWSTSWPRTTAAISVAQPFPLTAASRRGWATRC